jgi:membrane-associated phospholipid phosphatase
MTTSDHRGRASERRKARRRAIIALGATAAVASAGFALLTAAVARRDTARADEKLRKRTSPRRGNPVRRAADAISPAGKWWTYIPAALAASAYVLRAGEPSGDGVAHSRRSGAGAITLAGVVATGLNHAFDRVLPQPPAPPGRKSRRKPVFPSGHAFGPAAVGLSAAYVLSREGLASPAVALPAALVLPAVTSGGRLIDEKHWSSDVLGGFLGGIALAAACMAAYEARRSR